MNRFCASLTIVLVTAITSGTAKLNDPLSISATNAQIPPTGTFTATQICPATKKIAGNNPGNVRTVVGTTYSSIGFNSAARTDILLKIAGVTPSQRWVKSSCGDFQASGSPNPDPGSGNINLLPFFDNQNNPIPVNFPVGSSKDITPPPPQLEQFDRKVLTMCGTGFDAPVSEQSFRQLLQDYPDVLNKLKNAAGGMIKPNRGTDPAFTDDLVQIWFSQRGFKHILCGEISDKRRPDNVPVLDGLHFYGRYLQLQQQSGTRAGRYSDPDTKQEVVDRVIYTFGTRVVKGNTTIAEGPIKGYSYVLNAQEILIHATKAFKLFNPVAGQPPACLYKVSDPDAAPFQAVFVKKEGAIRTFYPDATPEGSSCGN
jgi:Bacterial EndoU nuclease